MVGRAVVGRAVASWPAMDMARVDRALAGAAVAGGRGLGYEGVTYEAVALGGRVGLVTPRCNPALRWGPAWGGGTSGDCGRPSFVPFVALCAYKCAKAPAGGCGWPPRLSAGAVVDERWRLTIGGATVVCGQVSRAPIAPGLMALRPVKPRPVWPGAVKLGPVKLGPVKPRPVSFGPVGLVPAGPVLVMIGKAISWLGAEARRARRGVGRC